mmetsp:Transcript_32235/g.102778  ORF Transcript_32235/g.102778 Transcript_32235/m.102778 type:complete len:241 (+) Transcript_32235:370-1092(+)
MLAAGERLALPMEVVGGAPDLDVPEGAAVMEMESRHLELRDHLLGFVGEQIFHANDTQTPARRGDLCVARRPGDRRGEKVRVRRSARSVGHEHQRCTDVLLSGIAGKVYVDAAVVLIEARDEVLVDDPAGELDDNHHLRNNPFAEDGDDSYTQVKSTPPGIVREAKPADDATGERAADREDAAGSAIVSVTLLVCAHVRAGVFGRRLHRGLVRKLCVLHGLHLLLERLRLHHLHEPLVFL